MKNGNRRPTFPARRRKAQSGAALVEGIVVISTMLCFLGLIMYARAAYGMKLDLQQQTRSETFYYASHGCAGGSGSEAGGAIGVDQPGGKAGADGPSGGAASATRSWNNASSTDARDVSVDAVFDQNANGSNASISLGKKANTSHVTANSNCTCNEPKYDSQLTAWFSFGKDMLQRGGGVADLFK
jgi:hypothetical protein